MSTVFDDGTGETGPGLGAPGQVPQRAHLRPADDPRHSCRTCAYFQAGEGHCTMWDAPVEPGQTCDYWAAEKEEATRRRPAVTVSSVRHLNRHFDRATVKAHALEGPLVKAIHQVLLAASREAARNFLARAHHHLTATVGLLAAGRPATQGMVALYPRPEEARAVAQDGGHAAGDLHVTLAYFDHPNVASSPGALEQVVRGVAAAHGPLEGIVGGIGAFHPARDGGPSPSILLPNVPGLAELRQHVVDAAETAGYPNGSEHGFNPHLTLDYTDGPQPPDAKLLGQPLHFDGVALASGDASPKSFPFAASSLTAATGDWTPPHPDEVLDTDALIAQMRGKLDPVRLAVAEQLAAPVLAGVGLAFDPTNPFAAGIISATKVTEIADTTRAYVMQIIRKAYADGLTVNDTAKAIRTAMVGSSASRARMIARTELIGTINAASLASTRVVAQATGTPYRKKWLTSPGAEYPRHETYDGLDGQEVGIDEAFDVGGEALQYPGDPDGDPGETINCRCSMSYVEPGGAETDADVGE